MTLKTSNQPVLEVLNISKRFDMTQALEDVSLKMYPGEIHALVGENGAGKSTLIKILTGLQQADQGELRLSGTLVKISNSQEAQAYGITAIYQEPLLFPDLDVAVNIFISHQDQGFFVRWGKMYKEAEKILNDLGYLSYYATYMLATNQIEGITGETFKAGRMGYYTIEKDPTRDKGLRVKMGPFTVYNKDNVEASAK
jgi:ABC-type sugar transport system ATPase subunit